MPRKTIPPDEISARFRLIKGDLTGDELKAKCGIDRGDWSDYERGRKRPDWTSIEKISNSFDISPTWLFFGRGSKWLTDFPAAQELNLPPPTRGGSDAAGQKTPNPVVSVFQEIVSKREKRDTKNTPRVASARRIKKPR